jgi:hypothetical protein
MSLSGLRRPIARLLLPFAVAIFLLEDVLVRTLGHWLGYLARIPVWARLEAWLGRLPPYGALVALAAPASLILPVKLMAVAFLVTGRITAGVATILLAKLIATAMVGRMLIVCRPALMKRPHPSRGQGHAGLAGLCRLAGGGPRGDRPRARPDRVARHRAPPRPPPSPRGVSGRSPSAVPSTP